MNLDENLNSGRPRGVVLIFSQIRCGSLGILVFCWATTDCYWSSNFPLSSLWFPRPVVVVRWLSKRPKSQDPHQICEKIKTTPLDLPEFKISSRFIKKRWFYKGKHVMFFSSWICAFFFCVTLQKEISLHLMSDSELTMQLCLGKL